MPGGLDDELKSCLKLQIHGDQSVSVLSRV